MASSQTLLAFHFFDAIGRAHVAQAKQFIPRKATLFRSLSRMEHERLEVDAGFERVALDVMFRIHQSKKRRDRSRAKQGDCEETGLIEQLMRWPLDTRRAARNELSAQMRDASRATVGDAFGFKQSPERVDQTSLTA
jgi:hypothetical protein